MNARVDVFYPPGGNERGREVARSLLQGAQAIGLDASWTESGQPRRPGAILVTYGMGGPDRFGHCMAHAASGGLLVAWDLGYWQRDLPPERRKYRLSIGGMHCPQRIMSGPYAGPARWDADAQPVGSVADPDGFVLLVGTGSKSQSVGAGGWTEAASRRIRRAMPEREVVYRPKPKRAQEFGVQFHRMSDGGVPIDDALVGCALVVCRHSNVAVDACRMGVPVVCDDGAAAAIYPRTFDGAQPDQATRDEFLRRLAWWQWSRDEMESGAAWRWLMGQLA